ncbi:hypothetical protein [Rhodococcus sp. 008]|uniref:hypothetical protein n=1 Tax=Rhodococcus sp. 008 TaxID=1723645 RepID=UPI0008060AAA|nr:hypothetical protein [Rhodococcus sp. 008]ANQ74428.1 hypothetical protein AOT96_29135 [Rhodococcus sp. 008]
MITKNIAAKIALATVTAGFAAAALAGTASAEVAEGPYTAKYFVLAPALFLPPLTAEASVHGDTLTIAGLTGQITPTPDGGFATIAGQRIALRNVDGQASYVIYVISTEAGVTLGQLDAR